MRKLKNGFTLVELIVGTIVIGILVTLGFAQFSVAQERSRRAEARAILGVLRSLQLNHFLDNNTYAALPDLMPNIPEDVDGTSNCVVNAAYYFEYSCNPATGQCTASRCTSGGKPPNAPSTYDIWLLPNGAWGGAQ